MSLEDELQKYEQQIKDRYNSVLIYSTRSGINKVTRVPETPRDLVGNAKLETTIKLFDCDTSGVDALLEQLISDLNSGAYGDLPKGKLTKILEAIKSAETPQDLNDLNSETASFVQQFNAPLDAIINYLSNFLDPEKLIGQLVGMFSGQIGKATTQKTQMALFYAQLTIALARKLESVKSCYIDGLNAEIASLNSELTDAPDDMKGIISAKIQQRIEELIGF